MDKGMNDPGLGGTFDCHWKMRRSSLFVTPEPPTAVLVRFFAMQKRDLLPPATDSVAAAREAGLRYVSDDTPGLRREAHGKTFCYRGVQGNIIKDPASLERIRKLAIPPAWTEVWIC